MVQRRQVLEASVPHFRQDAVLCEPDTVELALSEPAGVTSGRSSPRPSHRAATQLA